MSLVFESKDENSVYYEGNLDKKGKKVIEQFDEDWYCANEFFHNLDVYENEFCLHSSLTREELDFNTLLDEFLLIDSMENMNDFKSHIDDVKHLPDNARILLLVHLLFSHWMSVKRNESVIALIDAMDTEEQDNG